MKKQILMLILIFAVFLVIYGQSPSPQTVDVHGHLSGWLFKGPGNGYEKAAEVAVKMMDKLKVGKMILMPAPQTVGQEHPHEIDDYLPVIKKHPDRFILLGGGGTLNVIIQQAVKDGKVSEELKMNFTNKAKELLARGARGFGEMTAEHLSMNAAHPYITAPPDHPLFLLLADIAAEADVPIDLHMEAVQKDMEIPARLKSFPNNPAVIKQNIPQFEKLLMHNRKARIIWDHAGWDNTGQWTTELADRLLKAHPNLYISIRVVGRNIPGRPTSENNKIKADWAKLINAYPGRFMVGSDEFFLPSEKKEHDSSGSMDKTIGFLDELSPEIAALVSHKNAEEVFNIKK
jgi:hypothetical protein